MEDKHHIAPRPTHINRKMIQKQLRKGFRTSDDFMDEAIKALKSISTMYNPATSTTCPFCEKQLLMESQDMCVYCAAELAKVLIEDLPLIRGEKKG